MLPPTVDTSDMYANLFGFLDLPLTAIAETGDADVAILGLPYDLATSGRPGTRFGPTAIRQASANLRWEDARWPWSFELKTRLKAVDCGDVPFYPGNHEAFVQECEHRAETLIRAGKKLLSLGGDHYVALPLLRQHAARYGKLALIHFDAHTDTNEDGWLYDHGAIFHHARMEGLLDDQRCVQVGIRTCYEPDHHPFRVIDADQVCQARPADVCAWIRETVGTGPAYISFDIDCLDPAFAPGTGTPVAGGLSSNQALAILRGLAGLDLVGMDIVEVAPAYDSSQVTALAAATLALEFLYVLASGRA